MLRPIRGLNPPSSSFKSPGGLLPPVLRAIAQSCQESSRPLEIDPRHRRLAAQHTAHRGLDALPVLLAVIEANQRVGCGVQHGVPELVESFGVVSATATLKDCAEMPAEFFQSRVL